ncbi:hypothetical protein PR202_ga16783 [Eleusine coracana subsp. coracana]|uniref:Uncharacterized protein n=1 Tax=Eleusine coracana subsp. coracana TaxID=191504 RepID=A0AAV5CNP5_ELECO|nr:hypothetical protein PR202_ga16783 [Eleusine coracana subsp. coracana]
MGRPKAAPQSAAASVGEPTRLRSRRLPPPPWGCPPAFEAVVHRHLHGVPVRLRSCRSPLPPCGSPPAFEAAVRCRLRGGARPPLKPPSAAASVGVPTHLRSRCPLLHPWVCPPAFEATVHCRLRGGSPPTFEATMELGCSTQGCLKWRHRTPSL